MYKPTEITTITINNMEVKEDMDNKTLVIHKAMATEDNSEVKQV